MTNHLRCLLFVLLTITACTVQYQPKITEKDLGKSISKLASKEFQGRKAGTPGDSLSANFIRSKFKNAGLKLLYLNGFQNVKLITGFKLGPENHLSIDNQSFKLTEDFEPLSFSANQALVGKLLIAGYGLTVSTDSLKWDDYQNNQSDGSWVMIFEGLPDHLKQKTDAKKYGDTRSKVLNAIDHHAKGILIVSQEFGNSSSPKTMIFDKNSVPYSVPILKISQKTADLILSNSIQKYTVSSIAAQVNSDQKPHFISSDLQVKGEASVLPKITTTQNVVGFLPGNDPALANEYLIIGAHYDHLGFGGPGSGSRMPDSVAVHFGADDNASGVAAVIELAEKFAHEKSTKRPILFVAFAAEEFGLIGSKAFVSEPPFSLKNSSAMFNFDMVGRLDSAKHLTIGGVGTSLETNAIVDKLVKGFQLSISKEGYGPSDHASFYGENIPVIYFTSGVHDQYHTPKDTYDRINLSGEKLIVESASLVISEVANRDKKLTYQESGPKQGGTSGRTDLKVTLGIIPDFAGVSTNGMRIDGVTPGKPAAKAGLLKGDIILSIDGKKVGSIYDYMSRMKAYSPGQIISVDVLRGNETKVFLVNL